MSSSAGSQGSDEREFSAKGRDEVKEGGEFEDREWQEEMKGIRGQRKHED